MPTHSLPTQEAINRKMGLIKTCMREHQAHQVEALRGSYSALNARRRLHVEWDLLYDEWALLVLKRMVEQMDEPQAAS